MITFDCNCANSYDAHPVTVINRANICILNLSSFEVIHTRGQQINKHSYAKKSLRFRAKTQIQISFRVLQISNNDFFTEKTFVYLD